MLGDQFSNSSKLNVSKSISEQIDTLQEKDITISVDP